MYSPHHTRRIELIGSSSSWSGSSQSHGCRFSNSSPLVFASSISLASRGQRFSASDFPLLEAATASVLLSVLAEPRFARERPTTDCSSCFSSDPPDADCSVSLVPTADGCTTAG